MLKKNYIGGQYSIESTLKFWSLLLNVIMIKLQKHDLNLKA